MNIKKIISAIAMAICAVTNVYADRVDGLKKNNVSVILKGIEQVGDSLKVDIWMSVSGHNSKCASGVRYTPYLYSDRYRMNEYLSPVMIIGSTAYKSYQRSQAMRLSSTDGVQHDPYRVVRDRSVSEINYSVKVKKEDWMNGASLCLLIDEVGCGRNKRNDIRMLADAIAVEPEVKRKEVKLEYNFLTPPMEVEKIRSVSETVYLDYIVNRTNIEPSYMNNQEKLIKLNQIFDDVTTQEGVTVKKVDIEGYASPEGTLELNRRLSEGRARSLANYIRTKYPSLRGIYFNMHFGGENWDDLVAMLKESSHSWRDEALDIIYVNEIENGRESKLMALRGGNPYRYMLAEYFPYLRKSIVSIEYSVKNFDMDEAIRVMKTAPKNLSLAEMHMVASNYDPHNEEFRRVLETAALYFPDDEYLNLNLAILDLESRNLTSAYARLLASKAEDSAEYHNAMGAYVLLSSGDESAAAVHFRKAASMGSSAARMNLEQLQNNNR